MSRVRIDRIVLRGIAMESRHAERLRALVAAELTRLLDRGETAGPVPAVPNDPRPEAVADPVAARIAARLPGETRR